VRAATPQHIMELGLGFWASKAVLSAVELGVFSTLADAPADLPTLQRKLALHQRSARDFLDALVALKLLERKNDVYSNTADTDLFLDRAKPSYVGGMLEVKSRAKRRMEKTSLRRFMPSRIGCAGFWPR
jgi:hypothetical protein